MKKCFIFCVIGILGLWMWSHTLDAERIQIVIDDAKLRKSILAIPSFTSSERNSKALEIGERLRKVILSDLDFSGLFDFVTLSDKDLLEKNEYEGNEINFKEWGSLGIEFLIKGVCELESTDKMVFEGRLYNVKTGQMMIGKKYRAESEDARVLAHRFSDAVVKSLTEKNGIFQTKILFISDKTHYKELYRMDYDGQNIEQLTQYKSIVLSPAWSPDGKKISYSSYETHRQHIKNVDLSVMDLSSKKREIISQEPGLNTDASWSFSGNEIILTMSFEGNPEIYAIHPDGSNRRRITRHSALDVESQGSPDGSKIVFSSARAPLAHLYLMDKEGSNIERLTFAGHYNSTPTWSPNGDQIVFAGQKGKEFDLYILRLDGKGLRRLTKSPPSRQSESPSFSPDGRHIVFTSNRSGKYELYVINEDGSGEHPLLTNYGNITFPKWSPYLVDQ